MHGHERYIVIEAIEVRRDATLVLLRRLLRPRLRAALPWLLTCRAFLRVRLTRLATFWTTAQQLHGSLHVHNDFRRVALDTVLLPFAGLQLSLDVDLGAFAQVLASDLGDLAEH